LLKDESDNWVIREGKKKQKAVLVAWREERRKVKWWGLELGGGTRKGKGKGRAGETANGRGNVSDGKGQGRAGQMTENARAYPIQAPTVIPRAIFF
jgi:hypothetical protein